MIQANASTAPSREPTMEEILASIRRIIEDSNTPKPEDAEFEAEQPVLETSRPSASSAVEDDIQEFEREFAAADVFSKPVQANIEANAAAVSAQFHAAPSVTIEPVFEMRGSFHDDIPRVSPMVEIEESRPSAFHELRPIISETASRQVAKSFEHLSVALSEERNTSVAQMTEEMVRPMLQDWLDNNLPTLVERLVREEIERVSRGTR